MIEWSTFFQGFIILEVAMLNAVVIFYLIKSYGGKTNGRLEFGRYGTRSR